MGDCADDIDSYECYVCGKYHEDEEGYPVLCDGSEIEQKGEYDDDEDFRRHHGMSMRI